MRHLLLILVILAAAASAQAATYTVLADGFGDFPFIQHAIDAAADGDVIQLGNGTYDFTLNVDLDLGGKDISIVSISDDPTLCVLDCQGSNNNPHFGILYSGQGPGTLLRGVSIINGYSNSSGGCVILDVASPTIENCLFQDNYAYNFGGAIYAPEACSPVIRDCVFRDNIADYYGEGGALFFSEGGNPLIEGCTFEGNRADYGGAMVMNLGTDATVSGCTFYGNYGSAIDVGSGCALTMDTSILMGNSSYAVSSGGTGATAQLTCCDVFGNTSGNWTGIIAGQGGINNNIEANPFFNDPLAGDFRLLPGSPCAESNNPGCGQIGAWGVVAPRTITLVPEGLYTIQQAIDMAQDGDIVELLDGTYGYDGNRDLDFLGKAITVRSASGNPEACQVDCNGYESNFHTGFNFISGEGPDSILQGLMIKYAYSGQGAGVRILDSSPTLENCIFYANSSMWGGGVYIYRGSPVVNDCEFRQNQLYSSVGLGAGLFIQEGRLNLTNCRFIDNGIPLDDPDNGHSGGAVNMADLEENSLISGCTFIGNRARYGGALYFHDGYLTTNLPPEIVNCTFVDNAGIEGSVLKLNSDNQSPLIISQSLIAINGGDGWFYQNGSSTNLELQCSNVFGNAGGDWIGAIADQAGLAGNMSRNPKFCDYSNRDFTLEATSPCLPGALDNPTCGLIGAEGEGCDYRGLITAVTDIPNDQGRRVRVSWDASEQDALGAPYATTGYSVWRLINDPSRKANLPPENEMAQADRFPPGDWDYLTTIPASGESHYNVLCETLADSTIADGLHLSTFFVRAMTAVPTLYFDSAMASGYSVDNLAPAAPGNLHLETPDLLAWDEVSAADFNYFTVYGSQSEVLDGTAIQLGTTVGLSLDVSGQSYPYYLLTATDFSGNEGEAAALASGVSPVGDGTARPTRFALYPAWPNPGTAGTTFSFDLPRAAKVDLSVYDLAGRRVATLLSSEMPAGTHLVPWNGRVDGASGPLASGVYFYRLQAGQFSDSGRVVILK